MTEPAIDTHATDGTNDAVGDAVSEAPPATVRVPSITADAARASVSLHVIHLELARSLPDGSYTPILHLALPASFAADLSVLLAHTVELRDQLRAAAMSRALTDEDDRGEDDRAQRDARRYGSTIL